MDKDRTSILTVINMMVSLKMVSHIEKGLLHFQMALNILGNLRMVSTMDKENILTLTVVN